MLHFKHYLCICLHKFINKEQVAKKEKFFYETTTFKRKRLDLCLSSLFRELTIHYVGESTSEHGLMRKNMILTQYPIFQQHFNVTVTN